MPHQGETLDAQTQQCIRVCNGLAQRSTTVTATALAEQVMIGNNLSTAPTQAGGTTADMLFLAKNSFAQD